ncbi:MAG: tRNA epoxyqueuosine(34) reductase QueG [Terriglobales bacterium]
MSPAALRRLALQCAQAEGCELAGIAPTGEFPYLRHFPAWIAAGRHGEMRYLEREATPDASPTAPASPAAPASGSGSAPPGPPAPPDPQYLRADLRQAFPWARSVLCCALSYNAPGPRSTSARPPGHGWIARYAWGDDYHQVFVAKLRAIAARLAAGAGWAPDSLRPAVEPAGAQPRQPRGGSGKAPNSAAPRIYVDTGPLVERVVAYHAGLGWIGKNTCLIHPRIGSFFYLGVILLADEIEPDEPLPDRCGSCTRCIQACPTGALTPYQMDARRCLAYLNLELRGPIPAEFRAAMGDNVIGCDICQDVCPWNEKAGPALLAPELAPRPDRIAPSLAALAGMSEEDYRRAFRGSAVKRAKYIGLLRNLAVALGNNPSPETHTILAQLAQHSHPMVREHAAWALARLRQQGDAPDPALDAVAAPAHNAKQSARN